MGGLREIASLCGFDFDDKWTTNQFGKKLYDYLESNKEATSNAENVPITAKVRVSGKAQNRTALGIIHAYMLIHPETTLTQIRKIFPNSLNPDMGVSEIFIPADEELSINWNGYFREDDALLTMGDGQKVAVVSMWTKPCFEKLIAHAEQYNIIVVKFEKNEGPGKRGDFYLEYLNGFVPVPSPAPKKELEKKKSKLWLWILLALLLLGLLLAFLLGGKERGTQIVEKDVLVKDTVVVTVVDTVYVQQLSEIEKDFNAIQYNVGKSDLNEDAKFVLHDLVKLLEKNPELKVKIIGHTSAEGSQNFNQKLSEERAKLAVDFVISKGIASERLEFEGKGSSDLKNKENPKDPLNRRTEFIIIE